MTIQAYRCMACGYTASLPIETGAGQSQPKIIHCLGCRSLVSIPSVKGRDVILDVGELDQNPALCPQCKSPTIQPWHFTHPCPRCGEHMTKSLNIQA